MTDKETEEFFLKNYMCMPFNYKNTLEAVFYFCFHTNRNYETAVELLKKVNALEDKSTSGEVLGETRALGIALSEILSEDDFINYIKVHKYNKKVQYYTATRMILGERDAKGDLISSKDGVVEDEGLLSKCKKIASSICYIINLESFYKPC